MTLIKYFFLSFRQFLPFSPLAVKCNSSEPILRTLVALGCGLDVATKTEMKRALSLGVPSDLLVYSNTCKAASHLQFAGKRGINLTVFDSEFELQKIRQHCPGARLMVRLRADDSSAAIPMGHRFGCDLQEARRLIDRCREMGLAVVGVCFHVGCGSSDPSAYADAIAEAKILFNYAKTKGLDFQVLDIGGGIPGSVGDLTIPFTMVSVTCV